MAPMPDEAPVIRAVPLGWVVMSFLHRCRRAAGYGERCKSTPSRLKCRICHFLGHGEVHPMQRIGFVIFPGFQMMSLAAASVFEFANIELDERVYDVHYLSETGAAVPSS